MVICLERGADLHMAQLMPLPLLTVSCFSKIQIGFTFLVQAHPGSPGIRAIKHVCVCVCVLYIYVYEIQIMHNPAAVPPSLDVTALQQYKMCIINIIIYDLTNAKNIHYATDF